MKWSGMLGDRRSKYSDEFMAKFKELAKTHNAGEIAETLKIRKDAVTYLSRRDKIQLSKTGEKQRVSFKVKKEIYDVLFEEANKRNISIKTLAERLLVAIAKDKIFNAVLDEEKLTWNRKPSVNLSK
jgi:predicted DNA-binding protein YlxM (UPF0122 family)